MDEQMKYAGGQTHEEKSKDDTPGGPRNSLMNQVKGASLEDQQAMVNPYQEFGDDTFAMKAQLHDKTRKSLQQSKKLLGGKDGVLSTLQLSEEELEDFRTAAAICWTTRVHKLVDDVIARHDGARSTMDDAATATESGSQQLRSDGMEVDKADQALVAGVKEQRGSAGSALQSFRTQVIQAFRLPGVAAKPAKEATADAMKTQLKGVKKDISEAWTHVSKLDKRFDHELSLEGAKILGQRIPKRMVAYVMHALLDHQITNNKKLDGLKDPEVVTTFIREAGLPIAEFLPSLQKLGVGSESDGAFKFSKRRLGEVVGEIAGNTALNSVEQILENGQDAGLVVPKAAKLNHMGVMAVTDNITGILREAMQFGSALNAQGQLDPTEDESEYRKQGETALQAFRQSQRRQVPRTSMALLLEGDENAKHVNKVADFLDQLQIGMKAKVLARSKGSTPEESEVGPDPYEILKALEKHDKEVNAAALDLGLEMVNSDTAKALKTTYGLATGGSPKDKAEAAKQGKDVGAVGKYAMTQVGSSFELFAKHARAQSTELMVDAATASKGVRLGQAADRATSAAKHVSNFTTGMGIGIDTVSIILGTRTLLDDKAHRIDKVGAAYDVAGGFVGLAGTGSQLFGTGLVAGATLPISVLLAYFKLLSSEFAKMAMRQEAFIYGKRIEALRGTAGSAGNAAEYVGVVEQSVLDGGPGSEAVAKAYTRKASVSFKTIDSMLNGDAKSGWDRIAAVGGNMMGLEKEMAPLRNYLNDEDFKVVSGQKGEVTPQEMMKHGRKVLARIHKLMEELRTRIQTTQDKYAGTSGEKEGKEKKG